MTHSLKNPAQALGTAVIQILGSSLLFVVLACLGVLGLYVPEYLAAKVLVPLSVKWPEIKHKLSAD